VHPFSQAPAKNKFFLQPALLSRRRDEHIPLALFVGAIIWKIFAKILIAQSFQLSMQRWKQTSRWSEECRDKKAQSNIRTLGTVAPRDTRRI